MTPKAALILILAGLLPALTAQAADDGRLAAQLRALDGRVFSEAEAKERQFDRMMARDVRRRLQEANVRTSEAWQAVKTRADWEQMRDARLRALRESLGPLPVPSEPRLRVTGTHAGAGYRVENVVFESRPGLWVTANLYQPAAPGRSMPGILLCHSHHNPKTQGELQDMGMTWARQGCAVLVPDQLGHGERRQHPFRDAGSYPAAFRLGRQDYYMRYLTGMQLQLAGDSLLGWLVGDLMRGVDVLRSRPGVDAGRLILLGSVAGGGDPAAVAAALDPRIAAVAPFNFGGPQPETAYPLPADAEQSFNYAGSGSWESTRNPRLSARDGFLPWVVVGAVAPRRLIYAHEFSWDRERDPVWRRLRRIYELHDAPDRLGAVHGKGLLSGQPPASSHCNNIGPEHRAGIYALLQRWFDMTPPEKEYQQRRPEDELLCMTPETQRELRPVHRLAAEKGAALAAAAWRRFEALAPADRRGRLRVEWGGVLGDAEPPSAPKVVRAASQQLGTVLVERVALEVGDGLIVPVLVLRPRNGPPAKVPVVVACAQEGKQAFLRERSETLARLLEGGAVVCLPDLRGTGETRPDHAERGRGGAATAVSASAQMLGQTLLGQRLRDLRGVLAYLRSRPELDPGRVALWGDSFAPTNPPERGPAVPLDAARQPALAEPLGGVLALLGALFEDGVRAAYLRGGLVSYQSLLDGPFFYVPHDAVVPGALAVGDLPLVAAAVQRPLRLEQCVDGRNCLVAAPALRAAWEPVWQSYRSAGAGQQLVLGGASTTAADWLLERLK